MESQEPRKRRAGTSTGAKVALTAAAVAGTLGGWAAFGMAGPPVVAAPEASAAATATPAQPAVGAAPSFDRRSRRRGTFVPQAIPGQENAVPFGTQPEQVAPSTDQTVPQQTTPSTQQAPTRQLPQARSRSSR